MLSIELSYDLIKNNIGLLFLSILDLVISIMYTLILKTSVGIIYSLARNRIQTNRHKVVYFSQGMGLQKFIDKLFCISSFIAIHDLHYRT